MDYILSLGGKRLRPILTLAACEAFGGDSQQALAPALGIEVFHNFSLVHDDIMDQAPLRRASETVHVKWDINTAILSGDALLVEAYRLIAQVDAEVLPDVLDRFTQTARRLCEGQQLDMEFEQRSKVEEDEYLDMIEGKTSVLIGCALAIGARIGGADKEDSANAMYDFGRKLGRLFRSWTIIWIASVIRAKRASRREEISSRESTPFSPSTAAIKMLRRLKRYPSVQVVIKSRA